MINDAEVNHQISSEFDSIKFVNPNFGFISFQQSLFKAILNKENFIKIEAGFPRGDDSIALFQVIGSNKDVLDFAEECGWEFNGRRRKFNIQRVGKSNLLFLTDKLVKVPNEIGHFIEARNLFQESMAIIKWSDPYYNLGEIHIRIIRSEDEFITTNVDGRTMYLSSLGHKFRNL